MITVVLPAYNEEKGIAELLPALAEVLSAYESDYEVIVVDDGSTDATAQVAASFKNDIPVRLLQHKSNQGLAAALRTGLAAAVDSFEDGDVVLTMDSDNTHMPALIVPMLERIASGADVVIASRFLPGACVVGVPWYRRLLSWGASWLFRILLPLRGVRDYTCGYRAYRGQILRDALARYGQQLITEEGFSCMVQLLLRIGSMSVAISEVPIILRYDLKSGPSRMNVTQTVLDTLKVLVRHRLGWRCE